MNIKSTIIASTLFAASVISAPIVAHESGVNQVITTMVKQALQAASSEIEVQIDKTIISAGNVLSLDNDIPVGQVTIVDIPDETVSTKVDKKTDAND